MGGGVTNPIDAGYLGNKVDELGKIDDIVFVVYTAIGIDVLAQ